MRSRTYLAAAGLAVLTGDADGVRRRRRRRGDRRERLHEGRRARSSSWSDEESFPVDCIEVQAGSPTSFTFDNQDAQHHNLSVYVEEPKLPEDQAAPNLQFRSEDVDAGATLAIELPALEPGDHFFRCDYHPIAMTGTLSAV